MGKYPKINIIGSGLAGSEAAWHLAQQNIPVFLFEMRPNQMTPAHKTENAAELVCSNSFKSINPYSAPGILKTEMKIMGSLVLEAAQKTQVPGGNALSVDREAFSRWITNKLTTHPLITLIREEKKAPTPNEINLIATGPLTSESLTSWLSQATHESDLYFYDAIAPIIDAASITREHTFLANRYDKGGDAAYLNCPMSQEEYNLFIDALLAAEKVTPRSFEKEKFFQGCQPIEAIAETGRESLRYGPLKPTGLIDPKTGKRPYACLQLRAENSGLTAYNMVGFQTKLKYGDQSKVFKLIPALREAEFIRLGSIHRNTYVCGPRVLRSDLSLRGHPTIYLAGQITGVEGYLESASSGLLAAHFITQRVHGLPISPPPPNTGIGALLKHVSAGDPKNYQPMNACFAIFDPTTYSGLEKKKGKEAIREEMAFQSQTSFSTWWNEQREKIKCKK